MAVPVRPLCVRLQRRPWRGCVARANKASGYQGQGYTFKSLSGPLFARRRVGYLSGRV